MLTVEFEGIFSPVIESVLVSEEVGEDCHLSDNWTVLKDFLLKPNIILSQAIVNDSVEFIVDSAFVAFKMIVIALA